MLSLQQALLIESNGNLSCWIQVRKFWRHWRCHAGFRKASELEQSSEIYLCMTDGHQRGRTCQLDSIDLREHRELNLLKPPNSKQRKRKERKRERQEEKGGRREGVCVFCKPRGHQEVSMFTSVASPCPHTLTHLFIWGHKEKKGELCDQFLQMGLLFTPPRNSRGSCMGQLDSKTLRKREFELSQMEWTSVSYHSPGSHYPP